MPIPDFQSIMLPMLKVVAEKGEWKMNELKESTNEAAVERKPKEHLEISYQNLRKSLATELRNKIIAMSPAFFERLVVELLVKIGYGGSIKDAGKAIGKSGDEGIDGTI